MMKKTVLGRVWNNPVNRGLMFGQKIQIPCGDIYDFFIQNDIN